ncbi:MAG TPA: proline dehydrogenase family protein [Fimbriimonadaceae bacterium]|nr:proline dehydrogenase family protein [Fimbriimonadaceae bacterium]
MLSRTLVLKVSGWKPVERLIRSRLFRPFVRRFVPGESVAQAIQEAERLVSQGYYVSLDVLGENTKDRAQANAATQTFAEMLHAIAASPCSRPLAGKDSPIETTNISIKLTQCGLDLGDDFAEANYRSVVELAAESGNFVRVDMESSEYTERTVQMVERVFRDLPNTGTVLQSYLHRTPKDIEWTIGLKARVRLVKGAYLEPAEVAFQSKADVDEAYFEGSKALLERGVYPAFATHDGKLIERICAFAADQKIGKERFEFQMLFGIRRDLQEKLLKDGYNVRVYVPFGDSWYPYFSRRLAERPANIFFLLKSLLRR